MDSPSTPRRSRRRSRVKTALHKTAMGDTVPVPQSPDSGKANKTPKSKRPEANKTPMSGPSTDVKVRQKKRAESSDSPQRDNVKARPLIATSVDDPAVTLSFSSGRAAAKELGTNTYQVSLSRNTPGRVLTGRAGKAWMLKDTAGVPEEDEDANDEDEDANSEDGDGDEDEGLPPPPMAPLGNHQDGEQKNAAVFSGDDDSGDDDLDGDGPGVPEENDDVTPAVAAPTAPVASEDSLAVACTVMLVVGLANLLGMLANDFVFDIATEHPCGKGLPLGAMYYCALMPTFTDLRVFRMIGVLVTATGGIGKLGNLPIRPLDLATALLLGVVGGSCFLKTIEIANGLPCPGSGAAVVDADVDAAMVEMTKWHAVMLFALLGSLLLQVALLLSDLKPKSDKALLKCPT